MTGPAARPRGLPRPLDPVRSIRAKLALVVAASVLAGSLLTWYGVIVLQWQARYVIPVAVVAALGLTQLLAHGTTQPLRRMTAAVRVMAAGGTPGPVRATGRDEVGDLARAFNAMAADLADADAQRRDLLANVAHELRTPVTALQAHLENVVDGIRAADPETLHELLARAQHLGRLVDDLLDLARAEAGSVRLQRERVVLHPMVADVADEVAAVRPGCRIENQVPEDLVVDADPGRLRQVLMNLVDNAARHAGSSVDVRARRDAATTVLEVVDDGPGIPADDREAVFGRFARGQAVTGGGTGLGLAIARWAVLLHGGRLAVADSPSGCVMRVELPA